MFFTSCIIIAFFCFAFYLIWHQFLKKDTRLSTGLQVLRKKTGDLENLSLTVDTQVDRQMQALNQKSQHFENLLKQGRQLCKQLEKNIESARALQELNSFSSAKDLSPLQSSPLRKADKPSPAADSGAEKSLLLCEEAVKEKAPSHLKTVKGGAGVSLWPVPIYQYGFYRWALKVLSSDTGFYKDSHIVTNKIINIDFLIIVSPLQFIKGPPSALDKISRFLCVVFFVYQLIAKLHADRDKARLSDSKNQLMPIPKKHKISLSFGNAVDF